MFGFKKMGGVVLALTSVALLAGNAFADNLNVNGANRNMLVYAPSGIEKNRPLIIQMHGYNQDAAYQKNAAKWESIADTARVLARFYDGIEFRGFKQETVEDLAKYADVPVWNGLTDYCHPTQVLADFLTMEEKFGHLKGLTLAFVGDARNNVANSLMAMSAKIGIRRLLLFIQVISCCCFERVPSP